MSSKLRWLLILVLLSGLAAPAWPQPEPTPPAPAVKIYLFWAEGCPHCLKEKAYLQELARRDPAVQVIALEITGNRENLELLRRAGAALNTEVSGVPFTVVGRRYLTGWLDGASSGRGLEEAVGQARQQGAPDVVAPLMSVPAPPVPAASGQPLPEILHLPWFGDVNPKYLSLGLLTVVIGLLDGFNPCAMWVLVFLINLLLGVEDRKKMWLLGGAFIAASGAVYFLFMTAWLNLLVFLGFIPWVRVAIGLVALAAGGYNLREYWSNRAGACKLTGTARRQQRLDRIKDFVHSRKFWLALGGIILLALAVNLVELICSAGFPVVYIQVLSLTPMPFWQYYLYLLGYIFFFMLDDMIIFGFAMITLQLLGVGAGYKRVSSLVGGTLMLGIGATLIFKPGWLMFG
jgi:thiol-disulfide isomerase/thioredoxin